MAKMGIVENGLKRRRKSRRRRNPTAVAKTRKNPARRSVSLASAKAVAKRNGLKLVSTKTVANGRKRVKRRRRNGVTATRSTSYLSRRNGLLGNSKQDTKKVGTILAGAVATKTLSRIILGFAAPYLAQVGAGNYGELIVDFVVAVVVTPFIATKVVSGGETAKDARIGGLLVVGLTAIGQFAPSILQYNPFVTSPVVITNAGAGLTPAAVAQIAAGVASSGNPQAAAAKVGNAMLALDSAGAQGYVPSNGAIASRRSPTLVL